MTEKKKFRAVRGVRDILPARIRKEGDAPDSSLWNWFEQTARDVLESYNFREIRLPIFEETELFARSVGAETDIVQKEMYTFEDARGDLWAQREVIRNYVLSRADAPGDGFGSAADFLARLRRLAAGIEEECRSGAIELDERGERAIDYFQQGVAHLANLLGEARIRQDEVVRMFRLLRLAVAGVRLGESLTLRPEATASVVRAYIEHGMQMQPGLVKLYYAGPMFRRERPQKGRYRQFYQIGAEVLGASDHPAIDAELIEMLTVLIERSKVSDWTLLVNSIGDPNCRPAYVEMLRNELRKVKDRLGADSQRRVETNPLRVFDSKLPEEQEIIAGLPKITDHLCEACKQHFADLRRQLDLRQIPYRHEPRLVRGLDYYMRTTFEITSPHLGAQNALAGGGRYDGLSEMLGGPPAKGIGFALGEDRFIEVIESAGRVDAKRPLDVFIEWMGQAAYPAALRLARRLRGEGFCVELPAEEMKLRKGLSLAERLGARFAVILGENEVSSGQFAVKRMADGEQRKLAENEVAEFVRTKAKA